MSWDVSFYKFPDGVPVKPDESGEVNGNIAIGDYATVRSSISNSVSVRWEDSGWGSLTSPDFNIEFNLRIDSNEIKSFIAHVHEQEFGIHAIHEIATKNNWSVFDHQQSAFIDLDQLEYFELDEELENEEDEEFSEVFRRPEIQKLVYF